MAQTNVQAFSGDVAISSNLAVDTNTLFVDSVGNKVGIGADVPSSKLTVNQIPEHRSTYDHSLAPMTVTNPTATSSLTLNDPKDVLNLAREGTHSEAHGARATFKLSRYENSGTASRTRLDLNLAHGSYDDQNIMTMRSDGNVGIGKTNPGSALDVVGDVAISSNLAVDTNTLFVDSVGNKVGIGTDNPIEDLHIQAVVSPQILVEDTGSANQASIRFKTGVTDWAVGQHGATNAGDFKISNSTELGTNDRIIIDTNGDVAISSNLAVDTNTLFVDSVGNKVGIGTTNPVTKLDIRGGLLIERSGTQAVSRDLDTNKWITLQRTGNKVDGEGPGISFQGSYHLTEGYNNHMAMIKARGFDDNGFRCRLEFLVNDGVSSSLNVTDDLAGYFDYDSNGGQVNFTGQHRTFVKDVPFSQVIGLEGLIVSSDQNKYIKMDGGIETGSNAITISEALPVVSLSSVVTDKKCFGVICDSEKSENREDRYGRLFCHFKKEKGDTRVYINSVGEGAIWVTDINGSLESGDYITTSNVVGYGQKQDSEFLANYTVAKITMDCDFVPVTQSVQIIRKEMGDMNYWVKTTYENVTEEEYSNLADENRQIVDGIYQEITKEESKTEQEGYELEVRQELVNVLDEHGQIQWEDDPSGATEKAYKIRYLDTNGVETDEANAVHTAAFVGCTYHCG